jgi:hypothetical protein
VARHHQHAASAQLVFVREKPLGVQLAACVQLELCPAALGDQLHVMFINIRSR